MENLRLIVIGLTILYALANISSGVTVYKATICESKLRVLKCPTGMVIFVKSGFYGRNDRTTCPTPPIKTTKCYAGSSPNKLKENCNGKNFCIVQANNRVFGDPCKGTVKFVKMTYICRKKDAEVKATVCENKFGRLNCPVGTMILVKGGFYGRNDLKTCPTPPIKTTTCFSGSSPNKLKKNCNGKRSCIVQANNRVFGDPCKGTVKFVKVVYTCVRKDVQYRRTICEHKSRTLRCPIGMVISVKSGFYGRRNKLICPTPPIKTTKCFAGSSPNKLKGRCNGKNSCKVYANNGVFGDPCVGTVKYVDMTYSCIRK